MILIFSALLIGAITFAILRKPSKIEDVNTWGNRNIENAQITFKNLEINVIPKTEYKFCLLAETDETNEIEKIISFHESLNEKISCSGHTILTARIDFKSKIQWQFYSARPLAAEKLIKQFTLPVPLRVGKIEDPEWREYLFHKGKT